MTLTPTLITDHAVADSVFQVHSYGDLNAKFALISIHANERTAIDAALALIRRGRPIVLHCLVHTKSREIKIRFGTKVASLDPNRIFTPLGVSKTLSVHNYPYRVAWIPEVSQFADQLLTRFEVTRRPVVFAVHNNMHKGSLVIGHFLPGKSLANEALAVFVSKNCDMDDFYFVTTRALFERYKSMDYNVVLQHPNATDDGSLSYYCAKHNLPYVNVEVEHIKASARKDQLLTQQLMILDGLFGSTSSDQNV